MKCNFDKTVKSRGGIIRQLYAIISVKEITDMGGLKNEEGILKATGIQYH